MALVDVGLYASITLELHIAVGVAALYCRARGPMHLPQPVRVVVLGAWCDCRCTSGCVRRVR